MAQEILLTAAGLKELQDELEHLKVVGRQEIKEKIQGRAVYRVTASDRKDMILRHYELMLKSKPENIAVREMRKHIGWYIKGMNGAGKFRDEINHTCEAKKTIGLIHVFFEKAEEENCPEDSVE